MTDEGWIRTEDAKRLAHDGYIRGASDTIHTLVEGLNVAGRPDIAELIRRGGESIVAQLVRAQGDI